MKKEDVLASDAVLEEIGSGVQDLNECLPDICQGLNDVLDLLKEGRMREGEYVLGIWSKNPYPSEPLPLGPLPSNP